MPKALETTNTALQNFLSATEWINFELTNHCNIPCTYCDNKKLGNKGCMTIDNFKIIVSKLFIYENSHKKVIFCGYGEPFLNSDIYDMIDHISDLGANLTIQSNGKWQLNQIRIDSLFKINQLSVTIDAVTNDIFELSRPNTDVNEIFYNLRKIVRLKDQFSKHKPSITAKMNVFAFNKHQTHDFIRQCTEFKFDQISLARGFGPFEVMTTINKSEYDKYIGCNLDIANSLFDDSLNNVHNPIQPDQYKSEKYKTIMSNPAKLFEVLGCFDTATIKWDGTLLPCCWDIRSQLSLGNLVTDTLENVFSSENLTRLGRRILRGKNNPFSKIPCLSCSKFIMHFQPGNVVIAKRLILQTALKIYQGLR